MNEFITPLKEHYRNFSNKFGEMLPAFILWDSVKENYYEINPDKNDVIPKKPSIFGDDFSDDLEKQDWEKIKNYFSQFYQIKRNLLGFLSFKIGNSELNLKFSNKKQLE